MKNFFPSRTRLLFGLFLFIFVLSALHWTGESGLRRSLVEAKITKETIFFDRANPAVQAVIAVQNRHTPDLMALPEVVGTATGLTEAGRPAILIFTEDVGAPSVIPRSLEGVPVVVKVTGKILAMPRPPWAGGPGGGGGGDEGSIDPTARFPRPVPIGVSTGNVGECSAGTIGARVTDGADVYALSNNHVYALENDAPIGGDVLQPGRYDSNCNIDLDDVIGTLADFEPLFFGGRENTIDAAIAIVPTDELDNATPSDGYGMPKSNRVSAELDLAVQKYGRSTSLTKGTITGINATVNVGYSFGTAHFVDQIVVSSNRGPFIKAGDSGSLLVTDPGREPVGLLFAGNRSGKLAIANPIGYVLGTFGVTIDGQ